MKKLLLSILLTAVAVLPALAAASDYDRTADELCRYVAERFMPANEYVWNWNQAIYLKAAVNRCENGIDTDRMTDYVRTAMHSTMDEVNGKHPNAVISGLGMAYLAQITGDDTYRHKAIDVYNDYCGIPRASTGGVSHRDIVVELWDDTVYMVGQFLLQMYKLTNDEKYLKEAVFQLNAHAEKLEDPDTGMWYHGWDNDSIPSNDPCCLPGWAENPNRRNNEFWGRGNGWIAMMMADLLEVMPDRMPEYEPLKRKYLKMMDTLLGFQDKKTGHWYQLPAYPGEKGNFIESSCTAMFAYAFVSGIAAGLLPESTYMPAVERAAKGLKRHSLTKRDGYLVMKNNCEGTCIGDKDYYYNRGTAEREFGYGVAIMFYDCCRHMKK